MPAPLCRRFPAGREMQSLADDLWFPEILSERIDTNGLHDLIGQGTVIRIGGDGGDTVHDVHAFRHDAESGIIAVKELCVRVTDEELASGSIVGAGGQIGISLTRHGNDAA